MDRALKILILVVGLLALTAPADAYPILQLFIDGATYDPENESWGIDTSPFDLWIIGDVKKFGTIHEVKVAMALFGEGGSVTLTPKTTTVVTDPSTPPVPTPYSSGTGSNPPLPDHGVYNDASLNSWENWLVGDFTLKDSPIGDFITSFPTSFDSTGQINVYEVSITGWDRVHFDAFDHTVTTTKSGKTQVKQWTAPFSHDAFSEPGFDGQTAIPEPGALLLLGTGLVGLRAWARYRFRR